MIIEPIFSVAIGTNKLFRKLTESERDFLVNQKTYDNYGNSTSENINILDDEKLKELKTFLESSIIDYFKSVYSPDKNVTPYITQSWVNYTKPGEYHHKHKHPNSFISGVFYIDVDSEFDNICFYDSRQHQIIVTTKNYNNYNSETCTYKVQNNDLILFPSYLEHMVKSTKNKKTRISLSFNTFLKGYLGDDKCLVGLHLGE